jgi:hypothetical protein
MPAAAKQRGIAALLMLAEVPAPTRADRRGAAGGRNHCTNEKFCLRTWKTNSPEV